MPKIDIPWYRPVTIRLQNGTTRVFATAYDALDFLENEWPVRRGVHYANAIKLCAAALNRVLPAAVAREAFISSCIEAGLALEVTVRKPRLTRAA